MKHEESHDMDKKLVLQTKKINKERERKREQQDPRLKHWKSFSKTYKPDTRIIAILRIINGNYSCANGYTAPTPQYGGIY